jgi:hypothetical protein
LCGRLAVPAAARQAHPRLYRTRARADIACPICLSVWLAVSPYSMFVSAPTNALCVHVCGICVCVSQFLVLTRAGDEGALAVAQQALLGYNIPFDVFSTAGTPSPRGPNPAPGPNPILRRWRHAAAAQRGAGVCGQVQCHRSDQRRCADCRRGGRSADRRGARRRTWRVLCANIRSRFCFGVQIAAVRSYQQTFGARVVVLYGYCIPPALFLLLH